MKIIMVILFLAVFSYFSWIRGIMVVKSMLSVAFIGKRGKNYWGASFTSATGYTKRVIPFEKGSRYKLTYEENISGGNFYVEINCGKDMVRRFAENNSTTLLDIADGQYTVTTKFKKASGDYTLKWEKV